MLEKLLPPPVNGSAIFVDMNSFFASVEQQLHPELRGRPVGVCPFIHDATCLIAASVEAKRYGVGTGTRIPEARRLCPGIVLLANQADNYRRFHRQIMDALDTTRCRVIVRSIDEAYLKVPRDLMPNAVQLADSIKTMIRGIGSELACSAGVAPNLFLAKLATNLHKPDGLLEITLDDLEGLYACLGLRELPGISWRMERRLRLLGIDSPLQLYQAPFGLLRRSLGVWGEAWYLRLRGYEVDTRPTQRRMIGHQSTIHPQPASTRSELMATASQLCYKIATRLQRAGLAARTVSIVWRYSNHSYGQALYRSRTPFFDFGSLWHHAEQLLPRVLDHPVRFVSVSSFDLIPISTMTENLWSRPFTREQLSRTTDTINRKFGLGTIFPAQSLIGQPISDQVGFGNAPQAAIELAPK